jgi:hypothetical protein
LDANGIPSHWTQCRRKGVGNCDLTIAAGKEIGRREDRLTDPQPIPDLVQPDRSEAGVAKPLASGRFNRRYRLSNRSAQKSSSAELNSAEPLM